MIDPIKLAWESGIGVKKRIIYAVVALFFVVAILSVGAYAEMDEAKAGEVLKTTGELLKGKLTPYGILLNNLTIALIMMVPVIGHGIAAYILYQTGLVFSALAVTTNVPRILLLMFPILTFYGLVELLAYGVSLSEATIIGVQAWRRRLRKEARLIPFVVLVVFLLLLIAAIVEYMLIFFTIEFSRVMGLEDLEGIL